VRYREEEEYQGRLDLIFKDSYILIEEVELYSFVSFGEKKLTWCMLKLCVLSRRNRGLHGHDVGHFLHGPDQADENAGGEIMSYCSKARNVNNANVL